MFPPIGFSVLASPAQAHAIQDDCDNNCENVRCNKSGRSFCTAKPTDSSHAAAPYHFKYEIDAVLPKVHTWWAEKKHFVKPQNMGGL
jgi:hypothetical protein